MIRSECEKSFPRARDVCELVVLLIAALCGMVFLDSWFGMLVHKYACYESHNGQEAKSKYDAHCNSFFRLHPSQRGARRFIMLSLVVVVPAAMVRSSQSEHAGKVQVAVARSLGRA